MSVAAARVQDVRTLQNYVGGVWQEPNSAETIETRNPATGALLARVPLSGADDVDAAVSAARTAQSEWRAVPAPERARALMALRSALADHAGELASVVTQDMGKTLAEARGEVQRGIESCEAAIAMPHLLKGETLEDAARGIDVELVRQPVGVVAAITPFNFPAMIPLWFLPYAIGAGNAFVLKPSERDPLAAALLADLIDGLEEIPPGVFNLVNGAHAAVDALLDHPGVDAISFVGSARTAAYVYRRAAEHGKRVQALGGAKNAMILMPDADRERMTDAVTSSAFGAAGQRCLAGSVALLVGEVAEQDATRDALVAAASGLRTGDGADPDTDICPLVSPEDRVRVEAEIEAALHGGAVLAFDGRIGGGVGGAELGATIVDVTDPDSRLAREEVFGPVLAMVRVPDLDAAVDWINRGRYGNAAVICTRSGEAARRFRHSVEAGMLGVNVGVAAPVAWFPFAGWKDSFAGDLHANGLDAINFYTRTKVVTARWG